MKFFIPGVPDSETETTYQGLIDAAKDQLRTAIVPKRIRSINYVHDKRRRALTVGDQLPEHHRYIVMAILESQTYIVLTQAHDGKRGPIIMVSTPEVTEVEEFSSVSAKA